MNTATNTRSPEVTEACHIGGLWYTSWGYDQTNVEFFQVVRETKASVVLQEIGAEVVNGRLRPTPNAFLDKPAHMHRKPRGFTADGYELTGVNIDYCRTAWPTTAEATHYDTYAAGQPGH